MRPAASDAASTIRARFAPTAATDVLAPPNSGKRPSPPRHPPRPTPRRPRSPRAPIVLPRRQVGGSRRQPSPAEVWLRRGAPIVAVLALFALSTVVVPTLTPAPVGDDWVYARSVELLLRQGELRVLDLSVVTLLFQIGWGALWALLIGEGFGALRLSTVVLVGLGGWALYGLCRELGVARARAALGAAAYLFNPLGFALGFSFMTDAPFAALLVISTLGYARGLRPGRPPAMANRALLLGAAAAACAFLVRQQGALIPLAVAAALLLAGRLRSDRASVALLVRIGAIPAVALVGYCLWVFGVNGVPEQQGSFTERIVEAGWGDAWLLTWRLGFIEAMYVGFFALPLVVAAAGSLGRLVRVRTPLLWGPVAVWGAGLAVGVRHFAAYGQAPPPMSRMPYVPQYLGPTGVGPADLIGGRPWLVGWWALDVATAVCLVGSLGWAFILARRLARPAAPDPTRLAAGVVLMIALGQAAGALPPSFHFRDWIVSVDRYLLPLLPLALALGLWALRGVRLSLGAGWATVALFGLFATVATHDFLMFQRATWDLSNWATSIGVPLTRLDGGASWDGYHLYEYSVERGIEEPPPGSPWYIDLFAPAVDSSWIVGTGPIEGYDIFAQMEYSAWLIEQPTLLYLLRRQGVEGLP